MSVEKAIDGRSSDALLKIKGALVDEGCWGRLVVHGGEKTLVFRDASGRVTGRSTVRFTGRSTGRLSGSGRNDRDREADLRELETQLGLR